MKRIYLINKGAFYPGITSSYYLTHVIVVLLFWGNDVCMRGFILKRHILKKYVVYQTIMLTGILLSGLGMAPVMSTYAEEYLITTERQLELKYLLKQDCGSCHGLRLKGGLGPALLPEALKNKPSPYLNQVIRKGIPSSAMPPWETLLSDNDIAYLVFLLKEPQSQKTE